ncbi:DUF4153 domain-containing protein [Euzebya tangerina]|uniref:DUF4153 domain-containing protein n=1 Tax=Euzebya tangerina TaxID=591198 RepID=UPI000E314B86|nr:DUF4173 domain-containing protein [Euzebya tangerina]
MSSTTTDAATPPGRPDPGSSTPDVLFRRLRPPTRSDLMAVATLAAVALVLGPTRLTGLGVAVLLLGLVVVVARSLPARSTADTVLLAGAAATAVFVPLRTSPPTILFLLTAYGGALSLVATSAHGPSVWATGPMRAMLRGLELLYNVMVGPRYLQPVLRRLGARQPGRPGESGRLRRARTRAIVRGLLLAVPLLWLITSLLSADQVFAGLLTVDLPDNLLDTATQRVIVTLLAAWGAAAMVRATASACLDDAEVPRWLGITECLTVLVPLTGVFALFVGSQVYAATGGAQAILAEAGVSYAEYAREGFFQLLAVACITLLVLTAVLGSVRYTAAGTLARSVRAVTVAVTVGVLLVVASAVRRLQLYAEAFGLSELRLWAMIGAVLIGGCFVLVGLRTMRHDAERPWLLPAMVILVVATSLVVAGLSPDALIARTNIERGIAGGHDVDLRYLAGLSDDAVPLVVDALAQPGLDATTRADAVARLCEPDRPDDTSIADWNHGRASATQALARLCE